MHPRHSVLLLVVACGSDSEDAATSTSDGTSAPTTTTASSTSASGSTTNGDGTLATTTTADGSSDASDGSEAGSSGGPAEDGLIGWAAVAGDGVDTTTGGEGGMTVMVADLAALQLYAGAPEPYIIQLSGTITGLANVASDKTLEGLPGAVLQGGLVIEGNDGEWVTNVIVRNLTIVGDACGGCTENDAITVYRAHHVWIDHCDISDGDDGNLDITEESDYATVSWCRFSYSATDNDHRYSNLIGAADDADYDADDLRVTLHHNWWTENVAERMPRVRFGPVHVFNNYYTTVDELYCIRAGVEADVLAEHNYFDGVGTPFDDPDPSATLVGIGNVVTPGPFDEPAQGMAFAPPYPYTLDDAADVPAIVQGGVGPQ